MSLDNLMDRLMLYPLMQLREALRGNKKPQTGLLE